MRHHPNTALLLPLLLVGCSDYGFALDGKVPNADTEQGDDGALDTGVTGGDDTGPGEPYDPYSPLYPPDGDPPGTWMEDCDEGVEASFVDDEIYVLSWNNTEASGTLVAPTGAWYHLYTTSIMESGDTQWNESAYFRVTNATRPIGTPVWSNCGEDWVVADLDNHGSPGDSRVYVGTFWLDEGNNTLTMIHYCPRYRDGECTTFHNTDDPNTTCETSDVNSVHFDGGGSCVVVAD